MLEHTSINDLNDLNVEQENKLCKTLGGKTSDGFYLYYLAELTFHKSADACFNHVNGLYFDLFGEYRYSSWDVFRKVSAKYKYLTITK